MTNLWKRGTEAYILVSFRTIRLLITVPSIKRSCSNGSVYQIVQSHKSPVRCEGSKNEQINDLESYGKQYSEHHNQQQ
jgi:hypothetical protein